MNVRTSPEWLFAATIETAWPAMDETLARRARAPSIPPERPYKPRGPTPQQIARVRELALKAGRGER